MLAVGFLRLSLRNHMVGIFSRGLTQAPGEIVWTKPCEQRAASRMAIVPSLRGFCCRFHAMHPWRTFKLLPSMHPSSWSKDFQPLLAKTLQSSDRQSLPKAVRASLLVCPARWITNNLPLLFRIAVLSSGLGMLWRPEELRTFFTDDDALI